MFLALRRAVAELRVQPECFIERPRRGLRLSRGTKRKSQVVICFRVVRLQLHGLGFGSNRSNIRNIGPQVLFETTSVDVQVSIDTDGRVTEAHPVNPGKSINQALIGEAIKAAEQWTFEPATNRGKPVPANHVITFRFARGS